METQKDKPVGMNVANVKERIKKESEFLELYANQAFPKEELKGLEKYFNPVNMIRECGKRGFEIGFLKAFTLLSNYLDQLDESPSDHIADGKIDWDAILPDYREAIKNHPVDGTTAIWLFTWIQEQVKSQLKSRPEFSQGERE